MNVEGKYKHGEYRSCDPRLGRYLIGTRKPELVPQYCNFFDKNLTEAAWQNMIDRGIWTRETITKEELMIWMAGIMRERFRKYRKENPGDGLSSTKVRVTNRANNAQLRPSRAKFGRKTLDWKN